MRNQKRIMKTLLLITLVIAMLSSCLCGCKDESKEKSNGAESATTEPNKSENGENTSEVTDTPTATPTVEPTATTTPVPTVNPDVQVGDFVSFGSYEQDNNTSNGKEAIEWLVLDVDDGKALLISKYALDCQSYNTELGDVTWKTCTLRTWLNGTFYNTAFSSGEKAQVENSYVSAEDNEDYGTEAGNSASDKMFLLSISETEKYFNSDVARTCMPTAYAEVQRAYDDSSTGNCWWWLRSPGINLNTAACVNDDGGIDDYGLIAYGDSLGVRPALWINLDASSVTSNPTATPTLMPTVNPGVQIGDYVTFGAYEQYNNTLHGKEAIEWLVLDVEDGKALLISKYALDYQTYNTEYREVTWETCTLRTWLNSTFYNAAFSSGEKACIATSYVYAEDNEYFEMEAGNSTNDKVFLLSISEVEKYFNSDAARNCKPTAYAEVQGTYAYSSNGNCWWWLRTPGFAQDSASLVGENGDVDDFGAYVSDDYAVRPAIWINLDA